MLHSKTNSKNIVKNRLVSNNHTDLSPRLTLHNQCHGRKSLRKMLRMASPSLISAFYLQTPFLPGQLFFTGKVSAVLCGKALLVTVEHGISGESRFSIFFLLH